MISAVALDSIIRNSSISGISRGEIISINDRFRNSRSKKAIRIREWISQHFQNGMWADVKLKKKYPAVSIVHLAADEHGGIDNAYVSQIDWISAVEAQSAPYFVLPSANCGIGLVSAVSFTEYRGKFKGWASSCTEYFLVGRNEAGTFFAHRVTESNSVEEAINWIWGGRAKQIVRRQGDISIIKGAGPKGLDKLPFGHTVQGDYIVHDTHPSMAIPGKGERIIIGRRAAQKGNGTFSQTRD